MASYNVIFEGELVLNKIPKSSLVGPQLLEGNEDNDDEEEGE